MAAWWSEGAYGEIWHLDRWLSHRLMSISTRSDNSDSLTMNFSMSKHRARAQTQSQQWSREIRQANRLSYMGKHKHQYSATESAWCFESVVVHKMRAHGIDNLEQWVSGFSRSELASQIFFVKIASKTIQLPKHLKRNYSNWIFENCTHKLNLTKIMLLRWQPSILQSTAVCATRTIA